MVVTRETLDYDNVIYILNDVFLFLMAGRVRYNIRIFSVNRHEKYYSLDLFV